MKIKILLLVCFVSLSVGSFFVGKSLDKWQNAYRSKVRGQEQALQEEKAVSIAEKVVPKEGFELPISWSDLGPQLVKAGVIDRKKFEEAVGLTDDRKKVLEEGGEIPVKIDSQNSQFVVDLLWAIGLAQKSVVYVDGPMGQQYKKDVGNFASTGGWTLAKGDAVKYLGKFELFNLSPDQQRRVADIVRNIYRPCCGNPTWFPDCNHGMAALGAVEMMVAKNLSDEEIYKNVLKLNSFWFPNAYVTTAIYFDRQGVNWDKIDAKKVLGKEFSSGSGASAVAKKVGPLPQTGGAGSCGA